MSSSDPNAMNRRNMLALGVGAATMMPFLSPAIAEADHAQLRPGRDQPFDQGWRFRKGAGSGFEDVALNDDGWRFVDLPHDWGIEDLTPAPGRVGPFDPSAIGEASSGYTQGGEGWYRKRFRLDVPAEGGAEISFDGVAVVSETWVNGVLLGDHVHAFTPFSYDLTPHLRRDAENVVAVRVRNIGQTGRWYSGSGISRQVRIDVFREAARIARWGVSAWTRRADRRSAEVAISTSLLSPAADLRLRARLRDATGQVVAEETTAASPEVRQDLHVAAPALWSADAPNLYTLELDLLRGNTPVDAIHQPFGIRIVTMDAENGLRINGERVLLRGGCVHNDNGLIGAAAFSDAEERRVRLLKARGFNAVRSSHNPCSRAFREACDRHGMLLIEEAFDMWHAPKRPEDYSRYFPERWSSDLTAMVLSARNSPSVIMWSIGNEVPERTTAEGLEWSWKLANLTRSLDPSRPVTAAIHSFPGRWVIPAPGTARPGHEGEADHASNIFLDVVGYNYKLAEFAPDHGRMPSRVFYISESFAKDAFDNAKLVDESPYVLGEFLWTALDYIGEAAIGYPRRVPAAQAGQPATNFPVVLSFCGDLDLIGQQKPASLYRDVVWGLSPLELAVQRPVETGYEERLSSWAWSDELTSWTWPEHVGRLLKVRIYTSAQQVELRLNGAVVGSKTMKDTDKTIAEFAVPFAPGVLEAVAVRDGAEIGRRSLTTCGEATQLRLVAERSTNSAGRQTLHYVRIEVSDAAGRVVPDASPAIRLTVAGPAQLVGFGSGDPVARGSYQKLSAQSWHGRALAILRSTGRPGSVAITAVADGLKPGRLKLLLT